MHVCSIYYSLLKSVGWFNYQQDMVSINMLDIKKSSLLQHALNGKPLPWFHSTEPEQ